MLYNTYDLRSRGAVAQACDCKCDGSGFNSHEEITLWLQSKVRCWVSPNNTQCLIRWKVANSGAYPATGIKREAEEFTIKIIIYY